jgi:muramoyltetrapeptide carboxypeptidase LdcA involved in peptidoglycan recycling
VEHLESLGFRLRIAPHAMNSAGYVSNGIPMDYENTGRFGKIRGLLFGCPCGYTPEEREQLHEVILERTKGDDFPVVAGKDCGHTPPVFALPVGCRAVVDAGCERFEIVEPAVV